MKIRIISFTENGNILAEKLERELQTEYEDIICSPVKRHSADSVSAKDWTRENFRQGTALVFIGACGIAVRSIAPFVQSKLTDPAVLVLDEKGKFVIPLLSGHIGEANDMAVRLAKITKGEPVLTTATDVNGLFAVDVFARENGLRISDMKLARSFSAGLLERKRAVMALPAEWKSFLTFSGILPDELELRYIPEQPLQPAEKETAVLISPRLPGENLLQLIPRCLILGVGCRRGKSREELETFITGVLREQGLCPEAAVRMVSVDLKKEEQGLCRLAQEWQIPFDTYTAEQLNAVAGDFTASDFVRSRTGVDNICERAVMAAGAAALLIRKQAADGMTLAVGIQKEEFHVS